MIEGLDLNFELLGVSMGVGVRICLVRSLCVAARAVVAVWMMQRLFNQAPASQCACKWVGFSEIYITCICVGTKEIMQ